MRVMEADRCIVSLWHSVHKVRRVNRKVLQHFHIVKQFHIKVPYKNSHENNIIWLFSCFVWLFICIKDFRNIVKNIDYGNVRYGCCFEGAKKKTMLLDRLRYSKCASKNILKSCKLWGLFIAQQPQGNMKHELPYPLQYKIPSICDGSNAICEREKKEKNVAWYGTWPFECHAVSILPTQIVERKKSGKLKPWHNRFQIFVINQKIYVKQKIYDICFFLNYQNLTTE